jgi:hypothetical protein
MTQSLASFDRRRVRGDLFQSSGTNDDDDDDDDDYERVWLGAGTADRIAGALSLWRLSLVCSPSEDTYLLPKGIIRRSSVIFLI